MWPSGEVHPSIHRLGIACLQLCHFPARNTNRACEAWVSWLWRSDPFTACSPLPASACPPSPPQFPLLASPKIGIKMRLRSASGESQHEVAAAARLWSHLVCFHSFDCLCFLGFFGFLSDKWKCLTPVPKSSEEKLGSMSWCVWGPVLGSLGFERILQSHLSCLHGSPIWFYLWVVCGFILDDWFSGRRGFEGNIGIVNWNFRQAPELWFYTIARFFPGRRWIREQIWCRQRSTFEPGSEHFTGMLRFFSFHPLAPFIAADQPPIFSFDHDKIIYACA